MNFNFTKRRWHTNEAFKGEIWVINDLYEKYKNCKVEFEIKDDKGVSLKKSTYNIASIAENSAKKFFDINEKVLKTVEKQFSVHLNLINKQGESISANEYVFLIGDQKEATKQFNKMNELMRKKNGEYTYGNYFRFFDDMVNKNGKSYQSDTETPRATDYEK